MCNIYKINSDQLLYEEIDNEVMIISLKTGTYYALAGTGNDIWKLLESGYSMDSISSMLNKIYDNPDNLNKDLDGFVKDLLQERLITVFDSVSSNNEKSSEDFDISEADIIVSNDNYQKPLLKVYEDLQDLLTIDPIHDVDESGWPNVKQS